MSSPPRFRRNTPTPLSSASESYYVNTLSYSNSNSTTVASGAAAMPATISSPATPQLSTGQISPMNSLISRIFDSASSTKAKQRRGPRFEGGSPSPFSRANKLLESTKHTNHEADSSSLVTQIPSTQLLASNVNLLSHTNNQRRQFSKPRSVKQMQPTVFSIGTSATIQTTAASQQPQNQLLPQQSQQQESIPKSRTQVEIPLSPQSATNPFMLPKINKLNTSSSHIVANSPSAQHGQLHKSKSSKELLSGSASSKSLLQGSRLTSIERLKSEMSLQQQQGFWNGATGSPVAAGQVIGGTKEGTPTTKKLFHQVVSPSFFKIKREAPTHVYEKIAPITSLYNSSRLMDPSREIQEVAPIYPRYYHKGRKHDVEVFCGKIAAYTVINRIGSDKKFHIREYMKEQRKIALRNFENQSAIVQYDDGTATFGANHLHV